MIIMMLSVILFLLFVVLGSFHFYWLLGGTLGLEKVIPTKEDTTDGVSVPKFATLIVGLMLVLFGLLYLVKSGLITIQLPTWVHHGYWLIPAIFILRAIGDFNYVGFFKKIKNTNFAKADSKIFSPLCLFIGVIGILIQLLGQ